MREFSRNKRTSHHKETRVLDLLSVTGGGGGRHQDHLREDLYLDKNLEKEE